MKTGRKNNRGFTLVEIIIVVAIFTILLGIMAPSLNSILGFRVQRTTGSIAAALDKTKTEAMSRLVGEMELSRKKDGYYISFYLDRGKSAEPDRVKREQPEKIAPRNMLVQIKKTGVDTPLEMNVNDSLILTYDRSDGSFRAIQNGPVDGSDITGALTAGQDVQFKDIELSNEKQYCEEIIISGGFRKRIIMLNQGTGSYTIKVG